MAQFQGMVKQVTPEKVITKKDGGEMKITEVLIEGRHESVLLKCYDEKSRQAQELELFEEVTVDFDLVVRSYMSDAGKAWMEQQCRCYSIKRGTQQ